jgi:hypothetical protein
MAPKLHRLTLAFDGNSREAANVSSYVRTTARSRYDSRGHLHTGRADVLIRISEENGNERHRR